jgi:hypothetical protein
MSGYVYLNTDGTLTTGTPSAAVPQYVSKTSDTSRASTTTLADDPHLTLTLTAGTYLVSGVLGFQNSTVPTKARWVFTGTATGYVYTPSSNQVGDVGTLNTDWYCGSLNDVATFYGVVTVTVSGDIKLQWAQNSSNAGANVFKQNSTLTATKVA